MATTVEEALEIANRIGYPVMVRPSYVLGGRGMEVVYDDESMAGYMEGCSRRYSRPPHPHRPFPESCHGM